MTTCFNPRLMAQFADGTSLPKRRHIGSKFHSTETASWNIEARKRGGELTTFKAPCGSCHPCRIHKQQEWVIRCLHEAARYPVNTFITLTYDNEHLPAGGNLCKRDWQLFIDRLRKHYRYNFDVPNVRYFGCGEYGGQTKRPHYHAILFGIDFPDKQPFSERNGIVAYRSELLSQLWGNGNIDLSDATPGAIGYISGYGAKALVGERTWSFELELGHPTADQLADPEYLAMRELKMRSQQTIERRDNMVIADLNTGELTERVPEFLLVSRRPGIGRHWLDHHAPDIFKGFVHHNGGSYPIPAYYRKHVKQLLAKGGASADAIQYWKDQRIARLVDSSPVSPEEEARLRAYYVEVQAAKARQAGAPIL
jgi:hypothetical protein